MISRLGVIVEGHGEVEALPVLLRRILAIEILPPFRQPRSSLVAAGGLEDAVGFMRGRIRRNVGERGALLVVLDANGDPPCRMGPELLKRSAGPAAGVPISIVLAKTEFEAWFLGALKSLRGVRGIRQDAETMTDAENHSDAKGLLSDHMTPPRRYSPRVDQPALAAKFDIKEARRNCPSLDKFLRDVERLRRA